MIKRTLLILALGFTLNAAETSTTTTFQFMGKGEDKHGNLYQEKQVTITTKNYKVENFWNKLSFSGSGQDNMEFSTVTTTGKVRMTTEATSICNLYPGLDKDGCSGQKPFLINYEAIENKSDGDMITLLFQKDYDGTNILYSSTNNEVFYPLDVERTEKYYKKVQEEVSSVKCRSFFCAFTNMFDGFFGGGFFSKFFNHKVIGSNDGVPEEDRRQRYIANVTSGIDQTYLLSTGDTVNITKSGLNQPLSLIDYIEKNEEAGTSGSCKLFFFKFSESSRFCKFMSGMPFIGMFSSSTPSTSATTYEIDTIQTDTENALISFAGAYSDINVTEYERDLETYTEDLQPSTKRKSFFSRLMCIFFPCSTPSAPPPEIEVPKDFFYTFEDNKSIFLTMAVSQTGSAKIDDFQTFKLKSIHSLTGSQRMCTVENSFDNSIDGWTTETFKASEDKDRIFVRNTLGTEYYCKHWFWGTEKSRNESEGCSRGYNEGSREIVTPTTTQRNTEWWLDWCDEAKTYGVDETVYEKQCSGIFFFRRCKDVAIGTKLTYQEYTVKQYVNASKRGLSLDLELVTLKPTDKATTVRYKLMKVN